MHKFITLAIACKSAVKKAIYILNENEKKTILFQSSYYVATCIAKTKIKLSSLSSDERPNFLDKQVGLFFVWFFERIDCNLDEFPKITVNI